MSLSLITKKLKKLNPKDQSLADRIDSTLTSKTLEKNELVVEEKKDTTYRDPKYIPTKMELENRLMKLNLNSLPKLNDLSTLYKLTSQTEEYLVSFEKKRGFTQLLKVASNVFGFAILLLVSIWLSGLLFFDVSNAVLFQTIIGCVFIFSLIKSLQLINLCLAVEEYKTVYARVYEETNGLDHEMFLNRLSVSKEVQELVDQYDYKNLPNLRNKESFKMYFSYFDLEPIANQAQEYLRQCSMLIAITLYVFVSAALSSDQDFMKYGHILNNPIIFSIMLLMFLVSVGWNLFAVLPINKKNIVKANSEIIREFNIN